jgi:hypothetical protein
MKIGHTPEAGEAAPGKLSGIASDILGNSTYSQMIPCNRYYY